MVWKRLEWRLEMRLTCVKLASEKGMVNFLKDDEGLNGLATMVQYFV